MSKARKISTRLASHLQGFLGGRLNEPSLVRKLRRLAKDIEGDGLKTPAPAAQPSVLERVVFEHWKRRMDKPRAKLTPNRQSVIRARAKEGYTQAQMTSAVDACCASEWHMGDNDRTTAYNDLTVILRSGEKLEQFMAMGEQQGPATTESPEVRRLLDETADAMQRGDTAAYNDANARLKEARN